MHYAFTGGFVQRAHRQLSHVLSCFNVALLYEAARSSNVGARC